MTDGPAQGMTSRRPYLLRAMYEWIADNGMTPHLLVDASRPGVRVPAFAVNDGKVVLNVAARAVAGGLAAAHPRGRGQVAPEGCGAG